jgi:hypothetical protein
MNTVMPRLPRIAYSAELAGVARRGAEDVDRSVVAPKNILEQVAHELRSAMSLNAIVGPLDNAQQEETRSPTSQRG